MSRRIHISILLLTLICCFDLRVQAQEKLSAWDLPRAISADIDRGKYGVPDDWGNPTVYFQELHNDLETELLKSDPSSNFFLKKTTADQLALSDFNYLVPDSVGYFLIWGDSLQEKGDLEFFKPNLHVRELFIYDVSDCNLSLSGRFDRITVINCKNISVRNSVLETSYGNDKLGIKDGMVFKNCTFTKEFHLQLTEGSGKVQLEDCQFDLNEFSLSIPDSMQLVFANSPIAGIRKFTPRWQKLSNWLIPKGFLFWSIRQIDSLGNRFCLGYDDCLSADGNKLAWTENHKIVLHQFQEHYRTVYQFEKSDSVFRTLKELETETYRYDYQNPGSKDTFKAGIHYYFMSFMGWFCGYGTEPIMALYNAFMLILVFAVIYVIFPNRFNDRVPLAEDGFFFLGLRMFAGEETEIDRILKDFNNYLALHPNGTLWKYYHHRRRRLLAHYRNKLPKGIAYYLHVGTRTNKVGKFILSLYLKARMLPYLTDLFLLSLLESKTRSHWNILQKHGRRATFRGMLKGKNVLLIFLGIVVMLIARIPVGLLVSVNAFSTLGFGNLPLRGVTKYIAILEGLVGWFTLTLFSITYVNILLR